MTTTKRGVNVAIDYLNSFFPVTLIPDKLFMRAGCEGKISSLERNLRKAARVGKVKVIYERDSRGDMIAHYQGIPPVKKPIPLYFYEIIGMPGFSGYFTDRNILESILEELTECRLFTGTHEQPVEIKKS